MRLLLFLAIDLPLLATTASIESIEHRVSSSSATIQLPPPRSPLAAVSNWNIQQDSLTYNMNAHAQHRLQAQGRILFSKLQLSGCTTNCQTTASVPIGDTPAANEKECPVACRVMAAVPDDPGFWRPICSTDWTLREANVICVSLGYPGAIAAFPFFGGGQDGAIVANMTCQTGKEEHIHDCDYMVAHERSCDTSMAAVGVACLGVVKEA